MEEGEVVSWNKADPKYDIRNWHLGREKCGKGITLTEEEQCAEANKWEMSHGGISGRTAQQFINHLIGISKAE